MNVEEYNLILKKYNIFSKASTEAIFILENEIIKDFNKTAIDLFGYDPKELESKMIFEMVAPESRENLTRNIFSGIMGPFEITALKKDQSKFFAEIDFKIFSHNSETYRSASIRNITDRINAEESLQFYGERFEISDLAWKGLHIGFWDYHIKSDEYSFNKTWCDVLGYDYYDIDNSLDFYKKLVHHEDLPFFLKAIKHYIGGRTPFFESEYRIRKQNNDYLWVLDKGKISERDKSGKPLKLSGMYLDITEKKITEENLKKKNNDFNNLLMGILGSVSLILFDIDKDHPQYEQLKEIEQYVKKGSNITSRLLHSVKDTHRYTHNSINSIIRDSIEIFKLTRPNIDIQCDLIDAEPLSFTDKEVVEDLFLQVFNNVSAKIGNIAGLLIMNSIVDLDSNFTKTYGIEKGEYIKNQLIFKPSAGSLDFDEFDLFERENPFSGAYNITRDQNGIFEISSHKGHPVINIYLPLYIPEVKAEQPASHQIMKGQETIFLVDDEEIILKIGRLMAEKLGYKVITANNGKQAIRVYGEKKDDIDLTILDIVMPDISGTKVAQSIREIDRNAKVLFSSGYSSKDKILDEISKKNSGFLQKPFNIEEFSKKIRDMLDNNEI